MPLRPRWGEGRTGRDGEPFGPPLPAAEDPAPEAGCATAGEASSGIVAPGVIGRTARDLGLRQSDWAWTVGFTSLGVRISSSRRVYTRDSVPSPPQPPVSLGLGFSHPHPRRRPLRSRLQRTSRAPLTRFTLLRLPPAARALASFRVLLSKGQTWGKSEASWLPVPFLTSSLLLSF